MTLGRIAHPLITAGRLLKKAIIYVRQSSMPQVRDNWGSTAIQMDQADYARAFGWAEELIHVISDDLGRSGTGTAHRSGWQEMLRLITTGVVGAVFVWNVSRLTRELRDFEELRLLCKIYDVRLVIDGRPADPSDPRDTVLLQVQAAIAQLDNHDRARSMTSARREKARRGKVVSRLPLGWIEKPDGSFDFDPVVKPAIDDVIATFWTIGSVLGTVRAFVEAEKQVPVRYRRQLQWDPPKARSIRQFLTHPAYVGTYAYGMSENRPDLGFRPDGYPKRRPTPKEKWIVTNDHHPAYLSVADQERIRTILAGNSFDKRERPGRGEALSQGLLRCLRDGTTLATQYPARSARRYRCQRNQTTYGTRRCFDVKGDEIDAAIERIFLSVVERPSIEALRKALDEASVGERAEQSRIDAEQKRLEYAERVARDRYQECDPRNALVRAYAESELEKAMAVRIEFEQRLATAPQRSAVGPPEEQLEELCALSRNVSEIWHHPAITQKERKLLLRTLIDHVIVDVTDETIECEIRWKSEQRSPFRLRRRPGWFRLIRELHDSGLSVPEIRTQLAAGDPETGQRWCRVRGQLYFLLRSWGISPNPARRRGRKGN